mgnify:CR=1 FL=1
MFANLEAALHRNEHRLLGGMLVALYLALEAAEQRPQIAALSAVHLGLFLLWQPIWRRDRPLETSSILWLAILVLGFVASTSVAMLGVWQVVLIGLIAGRSFASSRERILYLASLGVLFVLLLFKTVPRVFALWLPSEVASAFDIAALVLACALFFVPTRGAAPSEVFPIDFFRGVTIALTTALTAATAVLTALTRDLDYAIALFFTLLGLVAFLLALSWLLSPRTGIGGLASLWEKSLLNIGTPFEQWLTELSISAETERDPDRFLAKALARLIESPGITGVEHAGEAGTGLAGAAGKHEVVYDSGRLRLAIHSRRPVGPALYLHYQLLLKLLADFYVAKVREAAEAQQSKMQAVYETGARMTHDVKNLLQSLATLTGVLEQEARSDDAGRLGRGHALMRAQLPVITARLKAALDKLGGGTPKSSEREAAKTWLDGLAARHPDAPAALERTCAETTQVPRDLFDLVADNLLDNLKTKRRVEPELTARLVLGAAPTGEPTLTLTDTGMPLPAETAARVLRQPVSSRNGFGIGLYQCAREAADAGYALSLLENRRGRVTFALAPAQGPGGLIHAAGPGAGG